MQGVTHAEQGQRLETGASITMKPIGVVHNHRKDPIDDDWDGVVSEIILADGIGEAALTGLETFSHVEVVFFFDRVDELDITMGARHPRGNSDWPLTGIFAQRGKNRPNRLGVSTARIVGRDGRVLKVAGLDAIDGTPVLDLKPVMAEFLPRGEVSQPEWSHELMRAYW
ncbi:MAG: SAM-dependent methyltransferase [Anaerolineales bacterium]|nr:SAM-dependent methyltransferase [Anaerolineales bacterium]